MRILGCLLLALIALPANLRAQSSESRGSLAAIFGAGRTWDDEGSLGTGPVGGGRVDWKMFGQTRIEASVDLMSHDRSGGFFEAEGRTTFIGASVVQRFGSTRVQPYILGGLHLVRHTGSTTFGGMRNDRESTDYGYHFGGGFAGRIGGRIEAGPEVRFYMIQPENDVDPALAYWIGGRVGIRF